MQGGAEARSEAYSVIRCNDERRGRRRRWASFNSLPENLTRGEPPSYSENCWKKHELCPKTSGGWRRGEPPTQEGVEAPMKVFRWFRRFFGFGEPDDGEDFEPSVISSGYLLGEGLTLKGEITGDGDVRIMGRFEGSVAITGDAFVGPKAEVDGEISATSIVVAGRVRGNLAATEGVQILSNGMLTGNFKSGSFNVADGAVVKGEVWVERSIPRLSASAPAAVRV